MEAPDLREKTPRQISRTALRGLRGAVLFVVAVSVIPASVYAYSVLGESVREPGITAPVTESLPDEAQTKPERTRFVEFVASLPTINKLFRGADISDVTPNKPKNEPKQENRPSTTVPEATGLPVRILIPSIGVDAPIKGVALASDGSMDVPKRPFDTVWYEPGARPGEVGSATIAGHVDWVNGKDAVFTDLHKVKPGDTISVQNDFGEHKSFVVRSHREYEAKEEASDVFYSYDGKSHLNLVTCSGDWDTSKKEFSKRLVVFAEMAVE